VALDMLTGLARRARSGTPDPVLQFSPAAWRKFAEQVKTGT
jgi:hypothetical protein